MGTVVTLRPQALVSAVSYYPALPPTAVVPPASDRALVLADGSDAGDAAGDGTYHHADPNSLPVVWSVSWSDLGLPAGARIEWVRPRARSRFGASALGTEVINLYFGPSSDGGVVLTPLRFLTTLYYQSPGLVVHWGGPQLAKMYTGGSSLSGLGGSQVDWTDAAVDALLMAAQLIAWNGGGTVDLVAVYLDVSYNQQPVVEVTEPVAASTVVTSRPTIGWTFDDEDLDPQERYEVKVFRKPAGGWGAVNPDTTSPLWSIRPTIGADVRSVAMTIDLPANDEYRAYVRATQPWSGTAGYFWSAWAYSEFDVVVNQPDSPSIVAWGDDVGGRNLVRVHDLAAEAELVVVEYSDDDVTWAVVRDGDDVPRTAAELVIADPEAPPNALRSYRAYVVDTAAGVRAASLASSVVPATWTSQKARLMDPLDPDSKREVTVAEFTPNRREPQGVFDALGREDPIVTSDGVKGWEGRMTLWAFDAEEYAALLDLLGRSRALLYQNVLGQQWYFRPGPSQEWQQVRAAATAVEEAQDLPIRHLHRVSFAWTGVRRP